MLCCAAATNSCISSTAASTRSRSGSALPSILCVSAIGCRAAAVPASFVLVAGVTAPTPALLSSDPISMVFPPHRTKREKSHPFPRRSYRWLALAQQAEDCLRQLVGLGQHRSTRLLHDLVLGQAGRLGCVVGVHDATASVGGVLSNVLQVADGRLEPVLHGTKVGAGAVYRGDGVVEDLDRDLSILDTENIQLVKCGR